MSDRTRPSVETPFRILLTSDELAEVLETSLDVVEQWRRSRLGPPPVRCGAQQMYDLADVQAFLNAEREQKPA